MSSRPLRSMLAMLVAVSLVSACDDDDDDDFDRFQATLSGANEVPARTTNASGSFTLTDRGTAMDYVLNVNNATNVTAAHIHTGAAGVNGGVLVPLFSGNVATQNGLLSQRTFTAADIQPLSGATTAISMDSLRALIRNGNAYVNVHTTQFPGGEIRGQITARN